MDKEQLKRHIHKSDLTAMEKRYLEGLVDGTRWIPCSERMPESGLTVHVFAVEGECELFFDAYYLKTYGEWRTYDVRARMGVNGFTFAVHPDVKITHWMPLPEPPEEREEYEENE